jgi:hypothetical protein
MRYSLAALAVVLFLFLPSPLDVGAEDQPPIIRTSHLDATPISVGALKIRFTKFRGSLLKIGNGAVEVEVENTSKGFANFNPQRLSFVGSDDRQVYILAIQSGNHYWPAVEREIAPGARMKEYYALSSQVRMAARVYYEGRQIAVISD